MIQALQHSIITFLDLAALSTLIGTALCILLLERPSEGAADYPPQFLVRIQILISLCISLLAISTIVGLIERGMEMSGLGLSASLSLLQTVVFKTHYGRMWLVRLAGITLAWIILLTGRRRIRSRISGVLLLFTGLVITFSRSASGHPADFGDLSSQQLADWLHLLAVSSWAGTLIAVTVLFPPSLVSEDTLLQRYVAGLAKRFYAFFGPLFAVLVFTGLYNAWFEVGSFGALTSTLFGRLLFVKLIIIALLAFRYIAPPEPGRDEKLFSAAFLHRSRVEVVAVFGLLLCVAVLVHQVPALHQVHLDQLKLADEKKLAGTVTTEPVVNLETDPPRVTAGIPVSMTVSFKGPDGSPLKDIELTHERILHCIIVSRDLNFFAHIHPEDIGPITKDTINKAVFKLFFTFPRAGDYLLAFDFAAGDESYSRTFTVTVAEPPAMAKPMTDFSTKKAFGDYLVTLTLSPEDVHAGEEETLRYHIEKNGEPVTDLEPYLGATMHLAVVSEDLNVFIHTHGVVPGGAHEHHDHLHAPPPPDRFGPNIESDVVFPVKGIYKIFSQTKHHGNILLFDFMVDVK